MKFLARRSVYTAISRITCPAGERKQSNDPRKAYD
jgi:hypothetical protein